MKAEKAWVALVDSGRWRRLTRTRVGSAIRSSSAFRSTDIARRYASTRYRHVRDRNRFSPVHDVCLFLGHVKSGGTLVGALLDAHPDALVSDEVDVLRYVEAGFGRDQIFHIIEKGSRREALKGRVTARRLDAYSLDVPGMSQGRSDDPGVMGDTRAGPTTRRLGDDLSRLAAVDRTFAPLVPKFVQVVRCPFDPISAMVKRSGRSLADAIADYEGQCRRLVRLRAELDPSRITTVRYESFVAAPRAGLEEVCGFVGLVASTDYLDAATAIVDPDREPERTGVEWTSEAIASVEQLIHSTPFLEGYRWE